MIKVKKNKLSNFSSRGSRWLSGRASDSGARGPGFELHDRHIVSLIKTLSKVLVNTQEAVDPQLLTGTLNKTKGPMVL